MNPGAAGGAAGAQAQPRVMIFEYPGAGDVPEPAKWQGWETGAPAASKNDAGLKAEFEGRLAEEARKAFELGRERGRQEARAADRDAQALAEQRRVRQTVELVERFAEERNRYLDRVEREVVELALAVAARILRREAQMDPLLLTGAVRVALGQLSATTRVRLVVPGEELALWTEAMALVPNLALRPEVTAGEGMRLGDCRIETELGTVDLGLRAQLAEIERGFFDRHGGVAKTLGASAESKSDAANADAGMRVR